MEAAQGCMGRAMERIFRRGGRQGRAWLTAAGLTLIGAGVLAAEPTYSVGPLPGGAGIVVSDGQIITPLGKMVDLRSRASMAVRVKAIALSPRGGTAAALLMGTANPVAVIDLATGTVRQFFTPPGDPTGSYAGLTYAADGKYLYFSQDGSGANGNTAQHKRSKFTAATVAADGTLSPAGTIELPPTRAIPLFSPAYAYPGGIATSADGRSAYVALNQNNSVGVIDLTGAAPALRTEIAVGDAPHSVVVAGRYAYVSNEGGRRPNPGEAVDRSSGTPLLVDPVTDSTASGTVSVIDTMTNTVTTEIKVGLHPTGLALAGPYLFVANAYGESISVIDTAAGRVVRTINLPVPVPNAYGSSPCGIAVVGTVAYVTLATANAIAVIDLSGGASNPVLGYIPTAYFPTTIAYDAPRKQLVVSSDKGTGAQGSKATIDGVTGYNTYRDTGVVNLIPLPTMTALAGLTRQVYANNHWSGNANAEVGPQYANPHATPVAIPRHIGEPSLIKKVFLIIKENRTYDQMLGDVAKGNGDPSLAVFADSTPNQHALIKRFPLFDNAYAPSRQSADGHPWIITGMSAYADEIQSPDWVRSYPGGNSDDVMVYTPRGFLWDAANHAGHSAKLWGEWSGGQIIDGSFTWSDWFKYGRWLEAGAVGANPTRIEATTDAELTTVPSAARILDPHYPSFNTGIPDQYRVDYWLPEFEKDVAHGTLADLTIMWLPDDHTTGYTPGFPVPQAAVADNDLALGRIVAAISHSRIWKESAVFVEEDDAQNGVDHVDGHRQPIYVISPYTTQNGAVVHTFYEPGNINRTIEQILGMQPLTQFDLLASPMFDAFQDTPDLAPFDAVPAGVALDTFPQRAENETPGTLRRAWTTASIELFRDKINKADSVDPDILNHLTWYAATDFRKPYPGEAKIQWPADLLARLPQDSPQLDPDGDGDGI